MSVLYFIPVLWVGLDLKGTVSRQGVGVGIFPCNIAALKAVPTFMLDTGLSCPVHSSPFAFLNWLPGMAHPEREALKKRFRLG